jgi:hypothetical protein
MKTVIALSFIAFFLTNLSSQDLYYSFLEKEEFEVREDRIREANLLSDLHHRYTSEWVDEYISTEIIYTYQEEEISVKGKNNELTSSQKELLSNPQVGASIEVIVEYLPKNNLKNNTAKTMDMEIHVIPQDTPMFQGGEDGFNKYVETNFVSKLDTNEINKLGFSVVQLEITDEGKTDNVYLVEGTGNIELDAKLTSLLCDMPKWTPATKSNGETVDYAMKFYITNVTQSCRVNEVIVRKESLSK